MPLFGMLGEEKHAPFFFAHRTQPADLWLLIGGLSLAVPAVLCLLLWLLNGISRRLASLSFLGTFAVLATATLTPMFSDWSGRFEYMMAVLALVSALLLTLLYAKTRWASTFLTIMSFGIVAAPILFLNSPGVRAVMAHTESQGLPAITRHDDRPNVVMIVLDELPLISLLDENHEIDASRFPNFRRLAETSNWYRNTAAVHYSTQQAVTAILVGGDLAEYRQAMLGSSPPSSNVLDRESIPQNLFSMLEDSYSIRATELITRLSPKPVDSGDYLPPLTERFPELVMDALVVYGHLLVPQPARRYLPHIEGQWRGFTREPELPAKARDWPYADSFKRLAAVREFIDSLKKHNVPTFYFLHSLLPHYPFVYNPQGQLQHNAFRFLTMHFRKATGENNWPDAATAELVYQAHLMQLEFVDGLLGRILDRLVEQDLFDDSVIVLTADHGTSYYWDSDHLGGERMTNVQRAGTLFVPLFIKRARQQQGQVLDVPLQTIDILPTLADLLGMEVSWPVSGLSALGHIPAGRERFAYLPNRFSFQDLADDFNRALVYKLGLFGSGSLDWMAANGGHRDLIGQGLATFEIETSKATATLSNAADFRVMQPQSASVPGYLEGQITGLPNNLAARNLQLAIVDNGIVKATTTTTRLAISRLDPEGSRPSWLEEVDDDRITRVPAGVRDHYFLSYLPAQNLDKGANEISVFGLDACASGRARCLLKFAKEPAN